MSLPLHEYILTLIECVALTVLVVRLLVSGLFRKYKFFFCYLIANLIQAASTYFISFRTNLYGYVFLATEGLMLVFYVLIVFELYSVVLRGLKGIARVAQRYTAAALALSLVIAMLLRTALPHPGNLMEEFFYFEAAVVLSVVLFILLITAFVVYYPVPLHNNALTYSIGYALYFLSKAALLFLNNAAASGWMRACSTAALVLSTLCIVFWAIYLSPEGERRTSVAGHRWSTTGTQEQVLKRLHQLNDSLLRTRDK
jgi:hypothetical protein